MKSKGLTEEGLAAIGYDETIIFRPALLAVPGGREEHRLAESVFAFVSLYPRILFRKGTNIQPVINRKITGVLSRFSDSLEIKTPILGTALVKAAGEGIAGLERATIGKSEDMKGKDVWVVGNSDAIKFGQA